MLVSTHPLVRFREHTPDPDFLVTLGGETRVVSQGIGSGNSVVTRVRLDRV